MCRGRVTVTAVGVSRVGVATLAWVSLPHRNRGARKRGSPQAAQWIDGPLDIEISRSTVCRNLIVSQNCKLAIHEMGQMAGT